MSRFNLAGCRFKNDRLLIEFDGVTLEYYQPLLHRNLEEIPSERTSCVTTFSGNLRWEKSDGTMDLWNAYFV